MCMSRIAAPTGAQSSESDDNAVIEVSELTYTYPDSDELAVDKISFSIREREIFGFLGPSGAGKSTTQKILIGLLENYSGTASVLGAEVAEHENEYYEHIGISSEAPNHYLKLTGLENLELFASLYRGETRDPHELLDLVGLTDAANVRVVNYSKGMKSRLNFIRALLHDPTILFLDEPTTGLDPANARNIKDIVVDLQNDGKTVFVTTHDMTVADQICDRVAFMIDGVVPVIETPDVLKREHGNPVVRVETRENRRVEAYEFPLEGLSENRSFGTIINSGAIESIHSEEATLEDVFLNVTGAELQ